MANEIRPTEGELEILQILWKKGPSTVREVNDQLNDAQDRKDCSKGMTPNAPTSIPLKLGKVKSSQPCWTAF